MCTALSQERLRPFLLKLIGGLSVSPAFPAKLVTLSVGNWPGWQCRLLPPHLALLPFLFHCLQANIVMYLKNLVILMTTISSYCTWHGFSPLQHQVSLVLYSLLFHLPTSHPSLLSSHCNRSRLAVPVPFGPFLLHILSSGTIVTPFNIFELLLRLTLVNQWSREILV